MTNCNAQPAPAPALPTSGEPTAPARRLLSILDLAHFLRVSKATAERLHAGGKLPAPIRLGRKVMRWDAAELNDWLARRKRSGDLYDRAEWAAVREADERARK